MIFRNNLKQIGKFNAYINVFPDISKKPHQGFSGPLKISLRYKSLPGASSSPGHGAGKGGGAGGSVRESGGGLGEYGAAQEEHYFYNKQKEQLQELQKKLKENKPEDPSKKEK